MFDKAYKAQLLFILQVYLTNTNKIYNSSLTIYLNKQIRHQLTKVCYLAEMLYMYVKSLILLTVMIFWLKVFYTQCQHAFEFSFHAETIKNITNWPEWLMDEWHGCGSKHLFSLSDWLTWRPRWWLPKEKPGSAVTQMHHPIPSTSPVPPDAQLFICYVAGIHYLFGILSFITQINSACLYNSWQNI